MMQEKETSRLIVKNLPKHITEHRLREHFEKQGGEVTDIKIFKERLFGFVGFKTTKAARASKNYFNGTYIDTSKVIVEFAKPYGSDDIPRPWSKYSKGSSQYEKLHPEPKIVVGKPEEKSKKRKKSEIDDDDPELLEFLSLNKPRSQSKFWANDDSDVIQPTKKKQKIEKTQDSTVVKQKVKSKKFGGHTMEKTHIKFDSEDEESDSDDYQDQPTKKSNQETEDDDDDLNDLSDEDDDESSSSESSSSSNDEEAEEETGSNSNKTAQTILETGRLFVRNLTFTTTEKDLEKLFSKYGEISEIHIPLKEDTKQSKGIAFILFLIPEKALTAFNELDATIFQGRLLHILPGKAVVNREVPTGEKQTFKQIRDSKRQQDTDNKRSWNSLFLRTDTVIESLADRYSVLKGDIIGPEVADAAVKAALMETHIITETKKILEQEGVVIDILTSNEKDIERSTTTILVKNLPFSANENELRAKFGAHGTLAKFVFPPSKTIALVEYLHSNEAKLAFRNLYFKKYQQVPLFLEWAPIGVFNKKTEEQIKENSSNEINKEEEEFIPLNDETENDSESSATLYIKNLNFITTEETLQKSFEKYGTIMKATIAQQKNMKKKGKPNSLGFGFVEFIDKNDALRAYKNLNDSVIDEHAIQIQFSKAKKSPKETKNNKKAADNIPSTKLMIRNVPFEATSKELRTLFNAYGKVKSVRLPKKPDNSHRGFAFVDFLTKQEAKNAFDSLKYTHIYGRHLVGEFAKDDQSLEAIRQKTLDNFET